MRSFVSAWLLVAAGWPPSSCYSATWLRFGRCRLYDSLSGTSFVWFAFLLESRRGVSNRCVRYVAVCFGESYVEYMLLGTSVRCVVKRGASSGEYVSGFLFVDAAVRPYAAGACWKSAWRRLGVTVYFGESYVSICSRVQRREVLRLMSTASVAWQENLCGGSGVLCLARHSVYR